MTIRVIYIITTHARKGKDKMKIYKKMVFDKNNNLIESESESYEYTGPMALVMPSPSPSPPNPVPVPVPVPVPTPVSTTVRSSGRALSATQRGRGVLIQSGSALGAQTLPDELTQKNLLQPQQQVAANILRLIGGGY